MQLNNPSVSYADSGRKCNWLPTLAKNMPPAYFLNASCPLHKGAFSEWHPDYTVFIKLDIKVKKCRSDSRIAYLKEK